MKHLNFTVYGRILTIIGAIILFFYATATIKILLEELFLSYKTAEDPFILMILKTYPIFILIFIAAIMVTTIGLALIKQGEKHKEELEVSQKIDAFKDNKKLYCDGTICSVKNGWTLNKKRIIKNKKFFEIKNCTL
ncbi:MAG: hypothetical protein U9N59_07130 [Campylobacterota bacterium]|nr:hypothetical protein [Campylobacterota bacterium]